jgi:NAD(P)H-hydrate epimerase
MKVETISKKILGEVFPKRPLWSRKGDFGRLAVIAGSEIHCGSGVFNALSALRSGCDLAFLVSPERAADAASRFPDLITHPLEGRFVSESHLKEIELAVEGFRSTALVMGCGLGRKKETKEAILNLIDWCKIPLVIDADGLRAVSGNLGVLRGKANVVLTPHANEFLDLSGKEVSENLGERIEAVKNFAFKWNCVVLLKGHYDIISDGNRVAVNKTGSPFMTKGGMGDALSGICGGFLARGAKPFEAACAAAWINGKAGEIACKKLGEGALASDLVKEIPTAIR